MKMFKMGTFFLLAILTFSGIQAQTADEIINKYIDALGGKAKLEQIKSAYILGTTQVMGNGAQSTTSILEGKGFRLEYEVNGQKVIQVFTDKGGWQVNPMMGSTTPQPLPEEMYKGSRGQIYITGPLYNYTAKGNKVELLGKEGNEYKLKITNMDSVETTVYIDGTTYYLDKLTRSTNFMGQAVELTINFSNFKKTDFGVVFPYSTEINFGGQFTITNTLDKIELNKPIDPSIFEMPKS
jgi:outer membrane lipoprotein-sorting protein